MREALPISICKVQSKTLSHSIISVEKEGDMSILLSEGNQCNASFESMVKDELSDNEDSTVSALLNYQQN
jgi:hypothetical protein